MKGRAWMIWVLSILVVLALLVAWSVYTDRSNYTYYKMTVEVETPQGVKTGHAVREVHFSPLSGSILGTSRPQWRLRGEAVAIDIAPGQTLFALLSSDSGQVDYAGRDVSTMLQKARNSGLLDPLELWPSPPGGVIRPFKEALPMLVTFKDAADPKSILKVEPDAMDGLFGPDVQLKRITVQAVDERVTTGIEARLEWLRNHQGSLDYSGRLHPQNPEKDLTVAAFKQGQNK